MNENDPYRALARLDFPLHINTGVSDLLSNALRLEGKEPQVAICPWNDAAYADIQEEFDLSKDRPLVYHMFGHLSDRESLVLTEDDYFDYLIGITDKKKLIPHQIRAAITN
ncbi:MAG TPA: SIR2 family protein, partial [Anaerolineae bacterium]|nr:SIR2 family protein [Anaerolineae bacterium]